MNRVGQFLKDVNLYAAVNVNAYDLAVWCDSKIPSQEEAELRFSALGGNAFSEAKRWYEWIRDELFSSCVASDLLWDFSVDEEGLRCKCRRRQLDGRYPPSHLNYGINWYYDSGVRVMKPDVCEFMTRCGLDCSAMPDYRADMVDY